MARPLLQGMSEVAGKSGVFGSGFAESAFWIESASGSTGSPLRGCGTAMQGSRLLIVDRDRDTREMISDLLADEGIFVYEAVDLSDAIRVVDSCSIDVVISSLPMLEERDRALGRAILAADPRPRVIATSAVDGGAGGTEVDVMLAKPFARSQILEALRIK